MHRDIRCTWSDEENYMLEEPSILSITILIISIATLVVFLGLWLVADGLPIVIKLIGLVPPIIAVLGLVVCLISIYEDDSACKAPTFELRGAVRRPA